MCSSDLHGLLETIGAHEKMTRGGTEQASDVRGLRQTRGIGMRNFACCGAAGGRSSAVEEIFPAAKSEDAQSDGGGDETKCGVENCGPVGATEMRETPACRDEAHELSRGRRSRVSGSDKDCTTS